MVPLDELGISSAVDEESKSTHAEEGDDNQGKDGSLEVGLLLFLILNAGGSSGADTERLLRVLNILDILSVDRLDDSEVSVLLKVGGLCKLGSELVNVSLSNGVNSAENVPVDISGTRRGGERPLVSPSLVEVDKVQQVTEGNQVDSVGVSSNFVPLKSIEESVDDHSLSLGELNVVIID